jgi:hypothetical protein
MSEWSPTVGEDRLSELQERKRLFDNVWFLTFFAVLLATGVPWYLRILDIDFGRIVWGLFGYGLIQVATNAAFMKRPKYGTFLTIVGLQQCAGITIVGILWHYAGNVQNPFFLFLLVMPLIAGSLVMLPWQSYATAFLLVVSVLTVAWLDAPDLRWNVLQTRLLPDWFARNLPVPLGTPPQPFPSLNTSPSYLFTLLFTVVLGVTAVVMMSESWNSYLVRLYKRVSSSRNALDKSESLSLEVVRVAPWPAALVYRDTFQVAQASESFLEYMLLRPEQVQQGTLFELVRFSDPEAVEELIRGQGGELPFAVYHVGQELRIACVRVHSMQHSGFGFAYVSFTDLTDQHFLGTALRAIDIPMVVLSGAQRVMFFNSAAKRVFTNLDIGVDAPGHLQVVNLPTGWWEVGAHNRRERQVQVNDRHYRAICLASRIPGEREALTILTLQPIGSGS